MNIKEIFAVSLLLFLVISCDVQTHRNMSNGLNNQIDPQWLQGIWEQQTNNGVFSESWKMVNDSTLVGVGLLTNKNDTLFSEKLSIYKSKETWYYTALVPGQNEGSTIAFQLTSSDSTIWIFENKKHDFPQRIIYHQTSPDSLVASVEGKIEGVVRKEIFSMHRKIIK